MPPKLDRHAGLAPLQDAGMRFKQADDLLLGRDFPSFEDSCARLPDHLLDQREEVVHGLAQALATHPRWSAGAQAPESRAQGLLNLPRLLGYLLGRLDEL